MYWPTFTLYLRTTNPSDLIDIEILLNMVSHQLNYSSSRAKIIWETMFFRKDMLKSLHFNEYSLQWLNKAMLSICIQKYNYMPLHSVNLLYLNNFSIIDYFSKSLYLLNHKHYVTKVSLYPINSSIFFRLLNL